MYRLFHNTNQDLVQIFTGFRQGFMQRTVPGPISLGLKLVFVVGVVETLSADKPIFARVLICFLPVLWISSKPREVTKKVFG